MLARLTSRKLTPAPFAAAAALVLTLACGALAPQLADAAWHQPVGGASPINESASRGASDSSLTVIAGVPYVAWDEYDGINRELRVARLNAAGTAWEKVGQQTNPGSPINASASQSAYDPSLTDRRRPLRRLD